MALSPMMKHYLNTKQNYPDTVLFYRLGDFYEMFFDDAVKVSKLLDLTLTGRDCGLEERAPMCGIPYHAADTYIAKLVALGEKVAICEQLTTPTKGKEIVERDVIKVISAGTVTENVMLDEKSNNYIASIGSFGEFYSISWADITTGDFITKEFTLKSNKNYLIDNLAKIAPKEILCNQDIFVEYGNSSEVSYADLPKFTIYKEWAFNPIHAEDTIKKHFGIANLEPFGIENKKAIISSAGALIEYLNETQKHSLVNLNKISVETDGEFMVLDANTIRNLELTKTMRDGKKYGSLLWLLDKTKTSMGSRNLLNWITSPLQDVNKINYRLGGVEELVKNPLMHNALSDILSEVKDTERISGKISNNNIMPRDCLQLLSSLSIIPSIKFTISAPNSKILKDINDNLYDFDDLTSLLKSAINPDAPINFKDGGYIADGFDKELDRLRSISKNSSQTLKDMLEEEKERTGIKNLKIGYNKVFGYFIEVTNSFKDKIPYNYIRKQTLVNAERFITEDLKRLEEEILTSTERILELEQEIFAKIKVVLTNNIKKIQRSSKAIAVLDTLLSFSTISKSNNYVKPTILEPHEELKIIGGRHPVVEEISKEQFISNDTIINNSSDRTLIITGPNMAGKSTYMRQVALITLMAHIGSYVPAKSAQIPIVDRIFTRVGASDNLIFDQSTFMVEMNEVSLILNQATTNSLLILDEVGRGTSTYDGLSIAWAVVEYITNKIKAKTLFATHYHELSELEGILNGVKNYKVTVKEFNGSIIFLRKIMEGSANKSFGIEVASLAGVPKAVTDNAKSILKKLEKTDLTLKINDKSEKIQYNPNEDNEVVKMLSELDVDNVSPKDALEFLYILKSKIGN